MLEAAYSNVHSNTFPAKSYIPPLSNLLLAPVDNNMLSFAVLLYNPSVHAHELSDVAYFPFAFAKLCIFDFAGGKEGWLYDGCS